MKARTVIVFLSAGVLALGGVAAGCDTADNTPQAKSTNTEQNAAPTTESATPATTESSGPKETVSQANARAKAEDYLGTTAFSKSGLIKQLQFEGFSEADATYGVGAVNVNWNTQAVKKAKEYLDTTSFSKSGLIQQLEYEGFTPAQAAYGVSQTGL